MDLPTRQRITDLRHLPLADGDPDDSPSCDEEP